MPHRYVCTALEELRECHKLLDENSNKEVKGVVALLRWHKGLIEEIQTLVNRMEATLYDRSDWYDYHKQAKKLKKDINLMKELKAFLSNDDDYFSNEDKLSLRELIRNDNAN